MSHSLTRPSSLILLSREVEPSPWKKPIAIAVALQVAFLLFGYYSPRDTLLDLIRSGETLAINPTDQVQEKKEIELELVPPPPAEPNPEFVKPLEVAKRIEPVLKSKPTPVVQTNKPAPTALATASFVVGNQNCPRPPYPLEAKIKHYQGTVVISISVVNGTVVEAGVASSSGYASLDSSATEWVRAHWRFPVGITVSRTIPIRYELAG